MEFKSLPLDQLEPPERSDKLHPYQDEDEEDWEEFTDSIGTEPRKPLEVVQRNGSFVIIDGDRRFRALEENDADNVRCFIKEEGSDEFDGENDRIVSMITANEFRKPSNKKQRSRMTAQIVAPWLLPPGERNGDADLMSQGDFSDVVGKTQASISGWLEPIRQENPLRATLAKKASGHSPDAEDIGTIDDIVDYMKSGGDQGSGSQIISFDQEQFVADELADMEGLSLSEILTVAKKGVEEGWNEQRFLEYTNENYAYEDIGVEDDIEVTTGDGDENPLESSGFEDGVDVEDVDIDDQDQDTEEKEVDFGMPDIEVDWSEHVDDSELDEPLSKIKQRRILSETIEDDAAIAINVLSAKTGMSNREVIQKFAEPTLVDQAIGYLDSE